jgi:hypothetical protein
MVSPNICDLIVGNPRLPSFPLFPSTLPFPSNSLPHPQPTNPNPENLALLNYPDLSDYYIVGAWHGYGKDRYWTAYLDRHAPYAITSGKEYTGEGKTSEEAYEDMFGKVVADVEELYGGELK